MDAYKNVNKVLGEGLTWGPIIGSPKFEAAFQWAQYNENGGSLHEASDGFSNDKDDSGGYTRYGITQATAGSIANVKALTRESAKAIYRDRYWNSVHCEEMPPQIALILMDFGLGSGPNTGAKHLQRVLGVSDDGVVGNGTLKALSAFTSPTDIEKLSNRLINAHLGYLQSIYDHNPSQLKWKPGWTRRALFIKMDDWFSATKLDRNAMDRMIAEQLAKGK